jgi:hypothetical protein
MSKSRFVSSYTLEEALHSVLAAKNKNKNFMVLWDILRFAPLLTFSTETSLFLTISSLSIGQQILQPCNPEFHSA